MPKNQCNDQAKQSKQQYCTCDGYDCSIKPTGRINFQAYRSQHIALTGIMAVKAIGHTAGTGDIRNGIVEPDTVNAVGHILICSTAGYHLHFLIRDRIPACGVNAHLFDHSF